MAEEKLRYRVTADTKQFESGMSRMGKVAKIAMAAVAAAVAKAAWEAVQLAVDYEESLNKVDVAFKKNAKEVKDWSETTLKSFGISKGAALDAAALFGDMGTAMGLTTDQAAEMSKSLVGLAGDLSSFKNIGVDQAVTALKGAFTGEGEPLKNLGIVMQVSTLEAYRLSEGIKTSYKNMTQAQKVALRYNFILDNTTNAQGDFSRTAEGSANQARILQGNLQELGITVGKELEPYYNNFLTMLNHFITEAAPSTITAVKGLIKWTTKWLQGLLLITNGWELLGISATMFFRGFQISAIKAFKGIAQAYNNTLGKLPFFGKADIGAIQFNLDDAEINQMADQLKYNNLFNMITTGSSDGKGESTKPITPPTLKKIKLPGSDQISDSGFIDDELTIALEEAEDALQYAEDIARGIAARDQAFGDAWYTNVVEGSYEAATALDASSDSIKELGENMNWAAIGVGAFVGAMNSIGSGGFEGFAKSIIDTAKQIAMSLAITAAAKDGVKFGAVALPALIAGALALVSSSFSKIGAGSGGSVSGSAAQRVGDFTPHASLTQSFSGGHRLIGELELRGQNLVVGLQAANETRQTF